LGKTESEVLMRGDDEENIDTIILIIVYGK